MKIEFDREADALYIQFQPGRVKKTLEIQTGILIDIAKDGRIFGIEILDASRRIPRTHLTHVNANLPVAHIS